MLSKITQKNPNIMGILEEVGVMPTVATIGPYYPKLVREFIFNMTEDVDDHASANYHKVTFRNFTFDFSPRIINDYFGRANRDTTGYNLQLSNIVKVLMGGAINTWPDKELPSSKLGVHVVDVPLAPITDTGGALGSSIDGTVQLLRDDIRYLDGIIQSCLAIKFVLEASLRDLTGEDNDEDDADVDPTAGDSGVETPST
ncbi:hypothetical protein LIER_17115 [Lithospermum erythrorhizon]|uniref:Uncharacterized protein n=1 Tax=Lithospermum erythrorhizon TaxID=34254 RepID=A0AAV3QCE7_LITER